MTEYGVPILWKNRDYTYRFRRHQVIKVVNDGQGYSFIGIGDAGAWGIPYGMNEKGLAVVNTAISIKKLPYTSIWGNLDLIRLMLYNASNIDKAYELLNSTEGKGGGSSFLLVNTTHAAVIDMAGDAIQVLTYVKNFTVRTNHWKPIAPPEIWDYQKKEYDWTSSTVKRYYATLWHFGNITASGRKINLLDVIAASRNIMFGIGYYSPCRETYEGTGLPPELIKKSSTLGATIFIPNKNDTMYSIMWYALGYPRAAMFMPLSICTTTFTAQYVEARNPYTNDEWRFEILASGEPWLTSEIVRQELFKEDKGLYFKYPELYEIINKTFFSVEELIHEYERILIQEALSTEPNEALLNELTSELIDNLEELRSNINETLLSVIHEYPKLYESIHRLFWYLYYDLYVLGYAFYSYNYAEIFKDISYAFWDQFVVVKYQLPVYKEMYYKIPMKIKFQLKRGWNLIAIPYKPIVESPEKLFSEINETQGFVTIWAWNATAKTYYKPTKIEPGVGYWILVVQDMNITVQVLPYGG